MAHITTELDEYPLIRLARNEGVVHVSMVGGEAINANGDYLVFLNGKCVEFTARENIFYCATFKQEKLVLQNLKRLMKLGKIVRNSSL